MLVHDEQPIRVQILDQDPHRLVDAEFIGLDPDLGLLGRLVRRGDARELFDLPRARAAVETLWIALLGDVKGDVHVHLDEGKGRGVVQGPRKEAVRGKRRNERGYRYRA